MHASKESSTVAWQSIVVILDSSQFTACSELSGRSSVALSSLLDRMDLRYTFPMMHWFAQPERLLMEILSCSVQPSKAVLGCIMLWSALTYISQAIPTVMVDRTSDLKAAEEHSCKQWSLQYVLWATLTICRACMNFAGTQASIIVTLIVDFDGRRQHISGLQSGVQWITCCCTCILVAAMRAYSNFSV